jgi:hypothetical protein
MHVIHIFGVERSGTNHLQWLVKENFKDVVLLVLWKHWVPGPFIAGNKWDGSKTSIVSSDLEQFLARASEKTRSDAPHLHVSAQLSQVMEVGLEISGEKSEDGIRWRSPPSPQIISYICNSFLSGTTKFLVNVKNPYSNALGLAKAWKYFNIDNSSKKWNKLNASFYNFMVKNPKSTLLVHFEDILENYVKILNNIKTFFNLEAISDKYITTNNKYVGCSSKLNQSRVFDANYYLKKQYLNDLSSDDIKTISDNIDATLCKNLNYEVLK